MMAAPMGSSGFLGEVTFDEVVFHEGTAEEVRFRFHEFRELPLRRRVHLLLATMPKFYRNGVEIPRTEAMRFS